MKQNLGFTIIEVLISILLLGLTITAVAIPLISFNKVNIQSRDSLTATSSAQLQLERARTYVISNYNNSSLLVAANLGAVTCANISALDEEMNPANCSLTANPPMRRLKISQTVTGQVKPVVLTINVRP